MIKKIIFLILVIVLFYLVYNWVKPQLSLLSSGISPNTELKQIDNAANPLIKPKNLTEETVYRVIDGDTIELVNGEKVRYIGINSPEIENKTECYGQEAKQANVNLVEGKKVQLEKDVSETDAYGRLLRYVYIDNTMVNEQLVKDGDAKAVSYPPDTKYQARFKATEKLAKDMSLGIWSEICKASAN